MSKKKREIPIYTKIIETHFHLDMLKSLSHEQIFNLANLHQVEKLITISTSFDNLDKVIALSEMYSQLYCSQGIHPHEGSEWNNDVKNHILKNLERENKIVAIGEIGLDYYYSKSEHHLQKIAFEEQLQIAVDHHLPVIIHSRDADEDTIAILKNFTNLLKRKGVIHSFTSGLPFAQWAIKEGFYLGFNGIITFKNAENVRDALRITPIERVLLETDAPFLTPDPYRGVENAPFYLPLVAEKIAEVKEISIEKTLSTIYQNSLNLFHF